MTATTSAVLAAALLLLAATAGAVWLWRLKSTPEQVRQARIRVRAATRQLRQARRRHAGHARHAAALLAKAEKERDAAIGTLTAALNAETSETGRRLASYRGVVLYEHAVRTPQGTGPVAGALASVDAQVGRRITATRLATLGPAALAVRKPTGALYLNIDTSAVAAVVKCPANQQMRARRFAVQIVNQGKKEQAAAASRPERLTQLRRQLQLTQDSGDVERLRRQLDAVRRDPTLLAAIAAAERAVTAARQSLHAITGTADATS